MDIQIGDEITVESYFPTLPEIVVYMDAEIIRTIETVTDEDCEYIIADLLNGEYGKVIWHSAWDRIEQTVHDLNEL